MTRVRRLGSYNVFTAWSLLYIAFGLIKYKKENAYAWIPFHFHFGIAQNGAKLGMYSFMAGFGICERLKEGAPVKFSVTIDLWQDKAFLKKLEKTKEEKFEELKKNVIVNSAPRLTVQRMIRL